jgi:hypothetical protein
MAALPRCLSRAMTAAAAAGGGGGLLRQTASLRRGAATETTTRLRYWADLWAQGNDVFTLPDVNPNLVEFLPRLLPALPPAEVREAAARKRRRGGLASLFGGGGAEPQAASAGAASPLASPDPLLVFVPLCGRSADLAYLAELSPPESGAAADAAWPQVHVVGLDAVAAPLRQLASEFGNGLVPLAELTAATPSSAAAGASGPVVASYRTERYPHLTLIHGDFFALSPEMLGGGGANGGGVFHGVWDRGGLTSIPPELRAGYLGRLHSLLAPGGRLLLEALACNLPLEGAVGSAGEVARLLGGAGFTRVETLRVDDVREAYPQFSPPGLTALDEVVLVAEKKR